ncbi:MAG: vanadium-dependent haloperoxidase [Acetobacteraceae bacterium]|nr:vanadium-dependent haloperoxidase [Acetobacteraceae bacterium]
MLAAALLLAAHAHADPVTEWTALADRAGGGAANWRTLAIMHQAMHDAWNAALPTYQRWFPAAPDEPRPGDALPQAAMAAAARRVLLELHPGYTGEVELLFREAMARLPNQRGEQDGAVLGDAIGIAAVRRRAGDGYERRHLFVKHSAAGEWRPVPLEFATSGTTETRPFLFASASEAPGVPPPAPGSAEDTRELLETMRIGSATSTERTQEQTNAAVFWAYQSSQRGFIALGAAMLDAHPRRDGLGAHARIMSQLAAAMADSAILVWVEKERYSHWRPVTAIRASMPGQDRWEPLVETPPHPEYPSGHAADCFVGAAVLAASFPDVHGLIVYRAQPGRPPEDHVGMGQHAQGFEPAGTGERRFPSFAAAAEECSESRIWAGAHIRAADEESRRVGTAIARRAVGAVPPLR